MNLIRIIFIFSVICFIISFVSFVYFIVIKNSKKQRLKEKYGNGKPLYTDSVLRSILYPIPDCGKNELTNSLLGKTIDIDTKNQGIFDKYVKTTHNKVLPLTYDLSTADNIYKKSIIPPIGTQGTCGSCWGFGVQALLYALNVSNSISESGNHLYQNNGSLPSILGLMDCLSNENNKQGTCPIMKSTPCLGCNGCDVASVFNNYFNIIRFICSEDVRPSDGVKCITGDANEAGQSRDCKNIKLFDFPGCGSCDIYNTTLTPIADIIIQPLDLIQITVKPVSRTNKDLTKEEILLIKKGLYFFGPLAFNYPGAYNQSFLKYKGNLIFTGKILLENTTLQQKDLIHSLTIVGWGSFNKIKCWKVRNSWGTDWGYQGYIWFPITTNIFYGDINYSKGYLNGIAEARICTNSGSGESDGNKALILITSDVVYDRYDSNVKISVKYHLGDSLYYQKLKLTIKSEIIDDGYNSEKFLPETERECGSSSPKFYVDNNNIVFDENNIEVTDNYDNYYEDEEGMKQTDDISLMSWFICNFRISIDKLLYNSKWIVEISGNNADGIILTAANIDIIWGLKIIINDIVRIDDGSVDPTNSYYLKFVVVLPITDPFMLIGRRNNINFPNDRIYLDTGMYTNSNTPFTPGTYTSLPLNPGDYYYLFESSSRSITLEYSKSHFSNNLGNTISNIQKTMNPI